ncbi:SDR family NAD(P)-dependent oxidoreductase [Gordonia sp. NPDC003424]
MTRSPFDLHGQVAVITGGNSGIGLAMADALAAAGADVCVWGRNAERNAAAQEQLERHGIKAAAKTVDVTDKQAIDDAVAQTVDEFGRVDSFFANAGTDTGFVPFVDRDIDEFRALMAINVDGVVMSLQAAARQMLAQGTGGSLVATASVAAIHGSPGRQPYAASKAALCAITRSLAVEYGKKGIRANSILPGWTETALTQEGLPTDAAKERMLPRVPVRRWGAPEDFGGIAVYLASPASAYHTGDTIVIDGGYSVF